MWDVACVCSVGLKTVKSLPEARAHLIKKKLWIDFLSHFFRYPRSLARRVTFALRWEFNWIFSLFFSSSSTSFVEQRAICSHTPISHSIVVAVMVHAAFLFLSKMCETQSTTLSRRATAYLLGHSFTLNYKLISIVRVKILEIQFERFPFHRV